MVIRFEDIVREKYRELEGVPVDTAEVEATEERLQCGTPLAERVTRMNAACRAAAADPRVPPRVVVDRRPPSDRNPLLG